MKFIKNFFVLFLCFLCSCTTFGEIFDRYVEIKLLKRFSGRIKSETDLVLFGYGSNNDLPKDYKLKQENGIAALCGMCWLPKDRKDSISLEEARCLVVSVAESLIEEMYSDEKVKPLLEFDPFPISSLNIVVFIVDENKVELGQGVANVSLYKGTLTYEGYHILQYDNKYPAEGRHYPILKESYSEALEIVKAQGCLRQL